MADDDLTPFEGVPLASDDEVAEMVADGIAHDEHRRMHEAGMPIWEILTPEQLWASRHVFSPGEWALIDAAMTARVAHKVEAEAELVSTDVLWPLREFDRETDDPVKVADLEKKIIADGALRGAIEVTYFEKEGVAMVTDGNHRLAVARRLGLPALPVVVKVRPFLYPTWRAGKGVPATAPTRSAALLRPSDIGLPVVAHKYEVAGYTKIVNGKEVEVAAHERGGESTTEFGVTSGRPEHQDPGAIGGDLRDFAAHLKSVGVNVTAANLGEGGWVGDDGTLYAEPTWVLQVKGDPQKAMAALAGVGIAFNQDAILTRTFVGPDTKGAVPHATWTFAETLTPAQAAQVGALARDAGLKGWTYDPVTRTMGATAVPQWGGDARTHRQQALALSQSLRAAGIAFQPALRPVRVSVMAGREDYERVATPYDPTGPARKGEGLAGHGERLQPGGGGRLPAGVPAPSGLQPTGPGHGSSGPARYAKALTILRRLRGKP